MDQNPIEKQTYRSPYKLPCTKFDDIQSETGKCPKSDHAKMLSHHYLQCFQGSVDHGAWIYIYICVGILDIKGRGGLC